MAARVFPAATIFSRARAVRPLSAGPPPEHRVRKLRHEFPIAANRGPRNRIRAVGRGRLTTGCGLLTRTLAVSIFTEKKKRKLTGKQQPPYRCVNGTVPPLAKNKQPAPRTRLGEGTSA